jgi:competence protein ComEC
VARWHTGLLAAARTQYAVTLGLIPLTMLLFGQMSLVAPIANAVAIPLVSFAVTPLALLGSIAPSPLIGFLLTIAHGLIEMLALGLKWLSAFPFAVWNAPLPSWWQVSMASCAIAWMLAPRGWPLRWLGFPVCIPLLFNAPTHPPEGHVWITAFDVGQGMALLVETAHHRLLYDTGPTYTEESDGGNRVILPYLKARGIAALDAMVVSHSDTDHAGGALSVLKNIDVSDVISSLPMNHPIANTALNHRPCLSGQSWLWDQVRFEIFWPNQETYADDAIKPNGRSCVLKITSGGQSILLAGDIEANQEAALLASHGERLFSTVLLAPHHGSGTSSTLPFLWQVNPKIAVFQVGYRNRYHHPKQEIFQRYGELGIERLRSDQAGAIRLELGDKLQASQYRQEHARYWYDR